MKLRSLIAFAFLSAIAVSYGYSDEALTTQQKYDALMAKGIFTSVVDSSVNLDQNMNRQQFARVSSLIFGLEPDTTRTSSFSDLRSEDSTSARAIPFIEAAKKAGLTDGMSDSTYNPAPNRNQILNGLSLTKDTVGSLTTNANGTTTVSAVVGTIKYVAPDGTTTTIDMGNGAIINPNGVVGEVTTLKALIERETTNGTAAGPNSLTTGLQIIVEKIAARVSNGEFGADGPAVLASIVATVSKANPADATGYAKTAIDTIATSDKLTDAQKKSVGTLIADKTSSGNTVTVITPVITPTTRVDITVNVSPSSP